MTRSLCAIGLLVAGSALSGGQQAPAELTAARAAIGAPASLSGLKSLLLEGVIQNLNHNTGKLGPDERLEIRILLPDNYLRLVRGTRVIRTYGFTGTTVLRDMRPVQAGPFTSRSAPAAGALDAERATLARLMLGMTGHTATDLPVTVAAPRGSAPTLAVTGPGGFTAWLDLAAGSHLPLQVRFADQVAFPVPGGTEKNLGYARVASMPPRVDAEVALTFEDRRLVDGLNLPHRIRRVARDVTFEEIRLKKIVLNPPLSAKDFEKR
jgi:hypothetical protein